MTAERLDRSRPPPGYRTLFEHSKHYCEATVYEPAWRADVEAAAIDAAWAHHEAQNDPPGLTLRQGPHGLGFIALGKDSPVIGMFDWLEQARSAAWQWYWRRVDCWRKSRDALGRLQGRSDANAIAAATWPGMLTWSDEQVDKHEAELLAEEKRLDGRRHA